VPYMLVVGEREMSEGTVSLRRRDGSRTDAMPIDKFIRVVKDRIEKRSRDL
jgi:threonyl-tRNA synthetase